MLVSLVSLSISSALAKRNTMNNIQYAITGGLEDKHIKTIHDKAMSIIGKVGLNVPHKDIRELLSHHDGVSIEGEDVRFSRDIVEASIKKLSYPDWLWDDEIKIISGAYELNVIDLDTGEIRPSTLKDLKELTKLQDSYGVYGSAPVRAMDIPTPLQEIAMYKVCWENSRHISNSILEANEKSSLEVAEYVYEMSQVADKYFSLGFWIASPFKTTYNELDIIYRFLDRKVPLWCSTMPIAGATAPIFLPGAYVQSIAELFAGVTLLNLISRGSHVSCIAIDSIRAYPFDMKFGTFVYGSPEDIFGTLFQIQLNNFYKIPVVAKSLLTTSQLPDAHAAAEKASHTVIAALAGARMFTNAGLLSVDEIFSAEQLVIDYEIVQYAKQLIKGEQLDNETLAVDAIREVGVGGTFLDHDTTLAHFRDAFWMPQVFEHRMLGQWREAGSESTSAKARRIAKERIEKHEFELSRDVQRELDRIWAKAVEQLT